MPQCEFNLLTPYTFSELIEPEMTDSELTELVRRNCPPPEFPTSFDRGVWQSIAVRENRKFSLVMNRFIAEHLQWLLKPVGATAIIAGTILVGASLGSLTSARQSETVLKAAYTASINPILSAHSSSPQ